MCHRRFGFIGGSTVCPGFHWVIALPMQAAALWFLFVWWASRTRLTALGVAVEQRAVRQTWG